MANKKNVTTTTPTEQISMWSETQQEGLVYCTLTDNEFGTNFIESIITVDCGLQNAFQNEHIKWVICEIISKYKERHIIPSIEDLKFSINNKYHNTSDVNQMISKELCTATVDRMLNTEYPIDLQESIKESAKSWIRNTLLLKLRNEIEDMLKKATSDDRTDYLTKALSKLVEYDRKSDFDKCTAEQISEGSLYRDIESNKITVIPTNSSFINDKLGGGIRKKEICIFGMSSGSGKSCVSSGLAIWDACLGYKVLHIALEDLDTSIKAKYVAMLTNQSAFEIETHIEDFVDQFNTERYRNFEKKISENLRTVYASKNSQTDFDTAEFDVVKIDKELTKLKYSGFSPDLVIIDYYDRLTYRTTNKLKEGEESYLAGKIMTQLDVLAKKWNVALFIPSQLTKEGDTKLISQLTSLDISGGKKKKDYCQSMFIMRGNPDSNDYTEKVIKVLKSRHTFDSGKAYCVKFDNGTCKFDNKGGYKEYVPKQEVDNALGDKNETIPFQHNVAMEVLENKFNN